MIQIGKYTPAHDGKPELIQREFSEQGYIVKDEAAYIGHPDKVCYVPELSDATYTHNDLLSLCDNQEALARCCFDCVNWQHPGTWVEEQFIYGEWVACPTCGRWHDAEDETACPHCGAAKAEE